MALHRTHVNSGPYRDDYRIFVNNRQDGEKICKLLTEVLIDLGLKLSASKTTVSDQLIKSAIKPDKLSWICKKQREKTLLKHLFIIHEHSTNFPNSGSLMVALSNYYHRILCKNLADNSFLMPIISVVIDIAYRNPKTYPITTAIISKLLSFIEADERNKIIKKIKQKFAKLPNTGYMEIWLQRITLPFDKSITYDEPICKLVDDSDLSTKIWNNDWINSTDLKQSIDPSIIINKDTIETLPPVITTREIELYMKETTYY